jgi:hypothetical protein
MDPASARARVERSGSAVRLYSFSQFAAPWLKRENYWDIAVQ